MVATESAAQSQRVLRRTRLTLLVLATFTRLHAPDCFSIGRQEPLRKLRDRSGLEMPGHRIEPFDSFTTEGLQLLRKVTDAGDRGDWQQVRSLFSGYAGKDTPVYNAVMHIAYRCGQYREASLLYERLCSLNMTKTAPTFTAALLVYSKLDDQATVKRVWSEARQTIELEQPVAGARIAAAARAGDVETAAAVLDEMNQSRVEIQVSHVSSAIRACWGAAGQHHNAAKYLFKVLLDLDLEPDIVTFTNLAGAYSTATLEDVLTVYAKMRDLGIKANRVFAEVYLTTLLSIPKKQTHRTVNEIIFHILECSRERVAAARVALTDFKAAGIDLTAFCQDIDKALQQLEMIGIDEESFLSLRQHMYVVSECGKPLGVHAHPPPTHMGQRCGMMSSNSQQQPATT